MLRDELRELLREFAVTTGADFVAVVRPEGDERSEAGAPETDVRAVPVGGGAILSASFAAPEQPGDDDRAAALERTARALRACARRWDVATLPPVAYPETRTTDRARVLERIRSFLRAFAASQNMRNALVTRDATTVVSAEPLGELDRERIPFIVKRVEAEATRQSSSSHAEVSGEDLFAVSFYLDAHLIAFFDGPYALDFVRHRARLVTRELSHLLPLLDDPIDDPAASAPIPD